MQDFGTKSDNTAGPSGELSAAEFNNLASENENAVLRSGQALLGASETQLAASLFIHGVKSGGFQDSGSANTYVATPISGSSGVILPGDYLALNGSIISFVSAATNTGASTLNIGQTTGTLLGAKPILAQGGSVLPPSALPANSIIAGKHITLMYDASLNGGTGAWVLLPWAESDFLKHGFVVFTASGTWNVPGGVSRAFVTVIGGGGGGGTNASAGGGGGGGGIAYEMVSLVGVSSVSVTVGAGGASGVNGGTSSFGAFCSATGGSGASGGAGQDRGLGGIGSGGDINDTLGPGYQRASHSGVNISGKGGGPGGGASVEAGAIAGLAATGFGCGGGGGTGGAAGGAGKAGIVTIRW